MAGITVAALTGRPIPAGEFGPYEPWVRPLLLNTSRMANEDRVTLDNLANPPKNLLLEVTWSLIAMATVVALVALETQHAERAGGGGAVDLGPIAPFLSQLHDFATRPNKSSF